MAEYIDREQIERVRLEDSCFFIDHIKGDEIDCIIDAPAADVIEREKIDKAITEIKEEVKSIPQDLSFLSGVKYAFDCLKEKIKGETDMTNEEENLDIVYHKGLEDARLTLLDLLRIPSKEWKDIFDEDSYYVEAILEHYSISEIADRIKAYKEEKKAKEEMKVGDEVISFSDSKAIVTMVDCSCVTVVFSDGSSGEFPRNNFRKTGRHFDEVDKLLDLISGGTE